MKMKVRRRIRYNLLRLFLWTGIIIYLTFFSIYLLIRSSTLNKKKINPLKMIKWSSIPIYIPQIPQNLIQTSKFPVDTNNVTNSFIRLNPTYKYLHYNDSTADQFVQRTMPDYIYQTYISLPRSIMKADYFRYIVLLVQGGIYTDIDTICLRPIDTWLNGINLTNAGLIIGIEADASLWEIWQEDYARQIQFVQWTIAAAPGHPILHHIVQEIAHITPMMAQRTLTEKQILEWTGPAIWTDIISNYFLVKYKFSLDNLKNLNKMMLVGEDIYVLPITAFSPGLNRMGSKSIDHSEARVKHLFAGTWKNINLKKRSC